jgi:hypothetical protein
MTSRDESFVDTKMTTTLRSWKGEERPIVVVEGLDPKRSGTCMRVEECSVSISLLVICGAKNASTSLETTGGEKHA